MRYQSSVLARWVEIRIGWPVCLSRTAPTFRQLRVESVAVGYGVGVIRSKSFFRRLVLAGVEAGTAAGLAWWVASMLLDSRRPIYATVAAVVVTGAGLDRRVGKVNSMLKGMGIAIILSEIGVLLFGTGEVQISVITALAVILTRLLTKDILAVVYAGLNAGILVGLGGEGWVPDRLLEALIGAGVAYTLIFLVLPPKPGLQLREALDGQLAVAQENLERIADSLRSYRPDEAADAERRSERIDGDRRDLVESFHFSEEVTRFSPWRRSQKSLIERIRRRTRNLEPILRDTTNLIRTAGRLSKQNRARYPKLAAAIDEHADAFGVMRTVFLAEEIPVESSKAISRHATESLHCIDKVASNDRLHEAVVEEIVNLAHQIRRWLDQVEFTRDANHDGNTIAS